MTTLESQTLDQLFTLWQKKYYHSNFTAPTIQNQDYFFFFRFIQLFIWLFIIISDPENRNGVQTGKDWVTLI